MLKKRNTFLQKFNLCLVLFISLAICNGCTLGSSYTSRIPARVLINRIPVRVLIVNFFEDQNKNGEPIGERHLWVERLHLDQKIDFPEGKAALYYNTQSQILNMLTDQGNINSSISTMALGLDPRFDLSKAYILLAGIAGGDPKNISLGSAVWSHYVIDGDLKHSIDPREMPKGWADGNFAYSSTGPNQKPVHHMGTDFFELNKQLVDWAYELTKDIKLPDDDSIQRRRALYKGFEIAQKPPFIAIGDNLTSSEYWIGQLKTEWARRWISYMTEGKGTFYTTAMEDTGVLSALDRLSQNGIVDKQRILSLRTISDYSIPWPGATPYEAYMADETDKGYSGLQTSLESAYLVGSKLILNIIDHWDQWKDKIPSTEFKKS